MSRNLVSRTGDRIWMFIGSINGTSVIYINDEFVLVPGRAPTGFPSQVDLAYTMDERD